MHGELPKKISEERKTGTRGGRRALATVLVLVAVAAALYYVYSSKAPAPQHFGRGHRFAAAGGPVPVLVASATRANVPVYLDAVGTVKAFNTVTVSPQVDGRIIGINFNEGQDIKKGDVLARIDPTIYRAQYNQAVAKKTHDEAQLTDAKIDLARYEKLAATNAINKQQVDTQRALVAQNQAQVQADEAAIENAKATLGYTTITAPISGRTGIRQIDVGNIVHASSSPAIVVITQLKPISVMFNLPQQNLDQIIGVSGNGPLPVDALHPDNGKVIESGKLTVVDNQVDAATGTVKLKAEFPNTDLQLWPGQFVNVRLLIKTLPQVVVVPTGAVQRGPNGTFVYVVNDQNIAMMTPIKIERQNENQTVIASGVTPPERVVTTGFANLTDGSKVKIGTNKPPVGPQKGAPHLRPQTASSGEAMAAERRYHGGRGRRPSTQRQ